MQVSRLGRKATRAGCLALGLGLSLAPEAWARRDQDFLEPVDRPSRDILLTEAKVHLARGRRKEAIYSLTRALHEHPDNLEVAWKLADLHYEGKNYPAAITLLRAYLDRSTRERNLYYPLGLCYQQTNQLRDALGAYARALQLDPRHLKAYVRLAQVRVRQGLPYDAREVLEKALALDPEYLPALEERKIVDRLIQGDGQNVYRKRNMVIQFHSHQQYGMVERAFPALEAVRRRLEDDLKYHLPMLWLRVENKVRRFRSPPALFDAPEDTVYVEAAGLEAGVLWPILDQMAHLYLEKMASGRLPDWLALGLALHYAAPPGLADVPLRSVTPFPIDFPRDDFVERRYLRFEDMDADRRREMAKALVTVRYLLETYGWVGMRKLLLTFREGERDFWKAAWKALHLDREHLVRKLSMYAIRGYYFADVKELRHP